MIPLLTETIWRESASDARLVVVTLAATMAAVLSLALRGWLLRRHLARIPIRIHVAGTRGKSTTTRLIAAALRSHGLRVYGKTTGCEPRLLLPDGSERPFPRWGCASVREQARLISIAARGGADAVVVECMAIQPEMLWASETLFIQATTLVLTNVRPDHFEEFGEDPEAIGDAFRWLVPHRGRVVATDESATDAIRQIAAERGADLAVVHTAGLPPMDANRKLALAVSALHAVDEGIAEAAMSGAAPDPGHFTESVLTIGKKTVRFANAFACNDVDSFAQLWRHRRSSERPVVVLNARTDRPIRTRHFLTFLARQNPLPLLFVAGDVLACGLARQAGFDSLSVRRLRSDGHRALMEVAAAAPPDGIIWGVGNYQGLGARLTASLAEVRGQC